MQRTRDELWSPDMKRSINSEKTLSHLPRKPPITSAPIANAEERNNLQVPGFPTLSHTDTQTRTQFAGCLRILTGRRRQPRMSTSRPTSEPRTHRVYLVIRLKDERESSRVMRVPNFWKQLGGRKLLVVLLRG